MLQKWSLYLLKAGVGLIALFSIFISILMTIEIATSDKDAQIHIAIIVTGLYAATAPFLIALYQSLKLLQLISKNRAFSPASTHALKIIMRCAFVVAAVFTALLPALYQVTQSDDAPGILLFSIIIIGMSMLFAAAADILCKIASKQQK